MTRDELRPLGVVYTPPVVARAMTRLALAPLVDGKTSAEILALRVLDPAAGAGAFLIEVVAYLAEHLALAWQREGLGIDGLGTNDRGTNVDSSETRNPSVPTWAHARARVVAECVFGVDIDLRALEVARGTLELDSHNDNVRVGDALALDWRAAFPTVFAAGGFDVVLANPPYIRQERLARKVTLESFEVYDGVADLYVYFVELAHRVLRPRGRYCLIVPNKWMTVAYGRPLRAFLAAANSVDGLVDFSEHALFSDADAFPCVVWGATNEPNRPLYAARASPTDSVRSALLRSAHVGTTLGVSSVDSSSVDSSSVDSSSVDSSSVDSSSVDSSSVDSSSVDSSSVDSSSVDSSSVDSSSVDSSSVDSSSVDSSSVDSSSVDSSSVDSSSVDSSSVDSSSVDSSSVDSSSVDSSSVDSSSVDSFIDRARWTAEPWHLDSSSERALLDRFARSFPPLGELIGTRWSRGVVTGLNEAFVLDRITREALLHADLTCGDWIRPFIKGRDLRRYLPANGERWLLLVDRGTPLDMLPAPVRDHLATFRVRLEPKPADHDGARWPGRKPGAYAWHELQDPVVPLAKSRAPRLFYQDIQTAPACSFDPHGELVPDTTVWIVPSNDRYLLAVLNSRIYGWYAQRRFPPALNGAVRPKLAYMQQLPIPTPSADLRREIEALVDRRLAPSSAMESASASDAIDARIDELVAEAYELTDADLAIVREP